MVFEQICCGLKYGSTVLSMVTTNGVTPALTRHPITLNDNRCNSSSTKAGVLKTVTGHGPIPPEGRTYYHWRGVTRPPPLLYPQPGARIRLFIGRLLIRALVVPPGGSFSQW
ncbi:hypothetical protein AVEN_158422-1 [Araneus ventricosus]|uniref:Uncharacterized protein n=1 Tax=Araneus ventricosus TaxID=182803 RepID=A0A4Y2J2W4_ARAVE|nr:hypothetical protein AVEN_158422-1 [Araneus ventricosus]